MYRIHQPFALAVQENILSNPYAPHLHYLLDGALTDVPTYLYGGALRNILKVLNIRTIISTFVYTNVIQ